MYGFVANRPTTAIGSCVAQSEKSDMPMVLLAVGLFGAVAIATACHQIRLASHRAGSRDEFLAELSASGVPREIAEIVYEYYPSESICKSFSVRPGDSLGQLFRREHDDVDHDALALVRRVGLELPNEDKLKQWPGPISTVLDMALWLTWVRQLH